MIKKILSAAIAVSMLLSLAGCGSMSDTDPQSTDSKVTSGSPVETVPDSSANDTVSEPVEETDDNEEELTPVYDNTAVLAAYRNGDASQLSDYDKAIYDGAVNALGEFYRDGMTEEEAVIAAHDWITTKTFYDEGMLLIIPQKSDDTETPYGVFVKNQGICMGYTTTFQLFMDMLGIDCRIVRGIASGEGEDIWEEHAWNLVNLDNQWYHVDCTWDDFVPDEADRPAFHSYCLVPDYVMEQLHIWNHDDTPNASAEDRIYFKTHGLYAETKSECSDLLTEAYNNGQAYAEIMTPSTEEISFTHVQYYWTHDLGGYMVTIFWIY